MFYDQITQESFLRTFLDYGWFWVLGKIFQANEDAFLTVRDRHKGWRVKKRGEGGEREETLCRKEANS